MTGPLITVEQQLDRVLSAITPLPAVRRRLADAHGQVLAADVRAAVDVPVFDNSAMDGFAVRFTDVAGATAEHPVMLAVVADLPAGTDADPSLAPGQAARIMTGSPVPADADAIVPFEDTVGGLDDSLATAVVTVAPAAAGRHIRRRGEDLSVGDVVLAAGTRLGALALGAVAATGVDEVEVVRRPRVAVVSTGSELVPPGGALRHGQIPESNSTLLAALAAEAGAEVVHVESVPDEGDGPAEAIARARVHEPDVVVFSGGVSAGAYEAVKNSLGDVMTFSRVAMQPGKPQGFGRTADGILLFGLPGNPVSAAVSFEVFVRPALDALRGVSAPRPVLRLAAAAGWRTPPGRRQYLPVVIDRSDPGAWRATPATAGGSHLAGGLGRAEAYAIVPAEVDAVAAGDLVDVMLVT
ncbi:molybdopterin molybdotransferase MoeA [Microbacterium sp. No. 7]|uniref:molybdopterin molybdotransferase MoeA n=1 Tax=Microbacterium sp. No. 7 TaxID=1714373 RepID=UPI0006D1E165|nr:gephyrin-like molybdotransferase Glp [Microbacterium sp. No. 7]ALJ22231.1 molybdopterin biosynthesis protein [Microbacterium sp. No. 7]